MKIPKYLITTIQYPTAEQRLDDIICDEIIKFRYNKDLKVYFLTIIGIDLYDNNLRYISYLNNGEIIFIDNINIASFISKDIDEYLIKKCNLDQNNQPVIYEFSNSKKHIKKILKEYNNNKLIMNIL